MSDMAAVTNPQVEEFVTGAHRGVQDGKPRYDLISMVELDRLQQEAGGAPQELGFGTDPIVEFADDTGEDMIPPLFLNRVNAHLQRGAIEYGRDNWKKGIPLSRTYGSLLRHVIAWALGDVQEDHLAAIAVNVLFIMWTEYQIAHGKMDWALADKGPLRLFLAFRTRK